FDKTMAAVHAPLISKEDISRYVNANLARLERFIQREIQYREASGQLAPNLVKREEVLDEAIAAAMGNVEERPEILSLERWLYRLAIRAIGAVASANGEEFDSIHLEENAGVQNVTASDEAVLQYNQ